MVNVTAVIFFGKSEKNIWVLDFFNYNLKYRISKTVNQIYSWNSITAITWNRATDLFVEQSNRFIRGTESQLQRGTEQQDNSRAVHNS